MKKPQPYQSRAVYTEINESQHVSVAEWPNEAGWDIEIGRDTASFMFQLDRPTWKALKRSMKAIRKPNRIGF